MKIIRMRDRKVLFENENAEIVKKWVEENCRIGYDGLPYYKNSWIYMM